MIRINLLSAREIKAEVGKRQGLAIAVLSLGATLVLMLGVFLYQFYRSSALERELAGLRQEIAALESQAKEVVEVQKKVAELQGKLKVIEDLNKRRVGPVRVMESLSLAAPERLWLTEFRENSGNLSLAGMAVDNQTVADFLTALSTSAYFGNVELVETSQIEQQNLLLKKFSLRSRILYQPIFAAAKAAGGTGGAAAASEGKKP